MHLLIRIITLSIFAMLLAACGSSSINTSDTTPQPPVVVQLTSEIPEDGSFNWLILQAEQANSQEESIYHYFNAANLAYDNGEDDKALSILETRIIPYESQYRYNAYFLMSVIYNNSSRELFALGTLSEAARLKEASLLENKILLSQQRTTALESLENWPEVVNERILLSSLLPVEQLDNNEKQLWVAIQNLTDSEIENLEQNADSILKGWLYISDILRAKNSTLSQQKLQYDHWRTSNPFHPAALHPPEDFTILANLNQTNLKNIGIALPMTGTLASVSKAISDGFLAAYYNEASTQKPQLTFINTSEKDSAEEILNIIEQKDLDILIGPLTKSLVARLASKTLPIPVIALNQLEVAPINENIHYFSLSSEDDMRELISFAKQEGATRAAVLGLNAPWALRQADEFRKIALEEKIEILDFISYDNQPNERATAVKQLLLVSESQQRKKRIEQLLDKSVNSIDRSRLDLDYVYYIGHLEDALQIRPSLDFYFAESIPMLASNTINNTTLGSKAKAQDAERILFSEVPALIKPNPILNRIKSKVSNNILKRLQAMGADAYMLANRYRVFRHLPNAKMSANTGVLTMDSYGVFRKRPELVWYKSGTLNNVQNTEVFTEKEEDLQ